MGRTTTIAAYSRAESQPPGRVVPDDGEADAQSMDALNKAQLRSYALEWTSSSNKDRMNPDFPQFGNNCANFVSQVLRAGGWQYRNGWNPHNLDNWSPDLTGPAGSSYTWGGAKHLMTFGHKTGEGEWLKNLWDARMGDLTFADWDPNGAADGQVDHAAVVSGYGSSGPRISQKSNNRHDVPLGAYLAIAKRSKTKIVWYGLKF